jgi:hypothetical protein
MAQIQVAEASKPKAQPKVLDHLEIHAKLGGGHIVKHAYTSYQHDPKEVHFDEDGRREGKGGGEHIVAHIVKHAGLPAMDEEGEEPEQEEEEDEA